MKPSKYSIIAASVSESFKQRKLEPINMEVDETEDGSEEDPLIFWIPERKSIDN